MKCLVKVMNLDPTIQIDIGNGTNEDLKELSAILQEVEKNPKDLKKLKEVKKNEQNNNKKSD